MSLDDTVLGEIWRTPRLIEDFEALCACGGRFAGTKSEQRALAFLRGRLADIAGARLDEHVFEYNGWQRGATTLTRLDPSPREFSSHALIWAPDTPPGGIEAEIVDIGRGTEADFREFEDRIAGRFVIVRQDYPFASDTIHRLPKYLWARARGAAGYILANPLPGDMPVSGFCPEDCAEDIPAVGVSFETAAALAPDGRGSYRRARIEIAGVRGPATGVNLIAEVPGAGPEWIVVSAHYDGHDLSQSALDNATGVAGVLQILRSFAPHMATMPRGLRVMFFTEEEWGLMGSRIYVEGLDEGARRAISLNVNLDTIAGSPNLSCLTSGFEELETFVETVGSDLGVRIPVVRPLKRNSDHYNFARKGIPAMRLVAGFDEPQCAVRYLLSPADTPDKVPLMELKAGAVTAAEFVRRALSWPGPIARHKSLSEMEPVLALLE